MLAPSQTRVMVNAGIKMRTIDAIAASAGLLGCAVMYAATDHSLESSNALAVADEARVFEAELARAFLWMSGAFERCYALSDTLYGPQASITEQSRSRALQLDACSAGSLTPGFE